MAKTVNLSHARTKFQRDVLRKIQKDKVCPFCEENFLTYHTKPIIKKGRHWILTENFQPYEGSKHHLLAVSRKHVRHFEKLTPAAQAELFSLFSVELKKRDVKGGTIIMRFGDTDYTGGTVEHLHAQLVSGAKRGKGREMILTALGYKTKN
ncbi:MAG: Histidine triad domain protein [Parcubacteria group bacterium]|nr:Histidine triad domain protein [Parcubacteria group bacterium]